MIKKVRIFLSLLIYYSILKNIPSRNSPNSLIVKLRSFVCANLFKKIGKDVNIQQGVYFGRGNKISIGDFSGIGEDSILGQTDEINIGKNVLIGPQLMVFTQNHNFRERGKPIREQGGTPCPVTIEDDVWIGARVTILPGVRIAEGSVIAAGAVVTRSFPPYSIIGGVPAKVIGTR
jgi:maltose O-acetyltransferase